MPWTRNIVTVITFTVPLKLLSLQFEYIGNKLTLKLQAVKSTETEFKKCTIYLISIYEFSTFGSLSVGKPYLYQSDDGSGFSMALPLKEIYKTVITTKIIAEQNKATDTRCNSAISFMKIDGSKHAAMPMAYEPLQVP